MTAERISAFAERVSACWSPRTASTYTESNPTRGQCSVTALLAHEELGGELLKTRVGEAWHFYNRIDGERVDLTSRQFQEPVAYDDVAATREEAMSDTSLEQLTALRRAYKNSAHNVAQMPDPTTRTDSTANKSTEIAPARANKPHTPLAGLGPRKSATIFRVQ